MNTNVRGDGHVADTRFERWAHSLRRLTCSLRGHDELFQFEKNRLFLRCVTCGNETSGWEIGAPGKTPLGKAA